MGNLKLYWNVLPELISVLVTLSPWHRGLTLVP